MYVILSKKHDCTFKLAIPGCARVDPKASTSPPLPAVVIAETLKWYLIPGMRGEIIADVPFTESSPSSSNRSNAPPGLLHSTSPEYVTYIVDGSLD